MYQKEGGRPITSEQKYRTVSKFSLSSSHVTENSGHLPLPYGSEDGESQLVSFDVTVGSKFRTPSFEVGNKTS